MNVLSMEFLKKIPKATMLNRKKTDPAKYVFTGEVQNEIIDHKKHVHFIRRAIFR